MTPMLLCSSVGKNLCGIRTVQYYWVLGSHLVLVKASHLVLNDYAVTTAQSGKCIDTLSESKNKCIGFVMAIPGWVSVLEGR